MRRCKPRLESLAVLATALGERAAFVAQGTLRGKIEPDRGRVQRLATWLGARNAGGFAAFTASGAASGVVVLVGAHMGTKASPESGKHGLDSLGCLEAGRMQYLQGTLFSSL
jgi:hypothetical protein